MALELGKAIGQTSKEFAAHNIAAFRKLAEGDLHVIQNSQVGAAFKHDALEIGSDARQAAQAAGAAVAEGARKAGQAAGAVALTGIGLGILATEATVDGAKAAGKAIADGTVYLAGKAADGAVYVAGKVADGAAATYEAGKAAAQWTAGKVAAGAEAVAQGARAAGQFAWEATKATGQAIADGATYVAGKAADAAQAAVQATRNGAGDAVEWAAKKRLGLDNKVEADMRAAARDLNQGAAELQAKAMSDYNKATKLADILRGE